MSEAAEVRFYHWVDKYPSGEIVRISGGDRRMSGDGSHFRTPMKEARFVHGVFVTSDPEIIDELRRIAKKDNSFSENQEVFYEAVLSPEERLKRAASMGRIEAERNNELVRENSRLKRLLESKGRGKQSDDAEAA
jgi:hypothetical protein